MLHYHLLLVSCFLDLTKRLRIGASSVKNISNNEGITPQNAQESLGSPTVRFASKNQEIEPEKSLEPLSDIPSIQEPSEQDIRELSATLHSTQLQNRRMSHFAFEPVSLPASRVCDLFFMREVIIYLLFSCSTCYKMFHPSCRYIPISISHLILGRYLKGITSVVLCFLFA